MMNDDYLGLDVGMVRTGIARASAVAKLAEPLTIVPTNDLVGELMRLSKDKVLKGLIVGLPRSLDGNETAQTKWVREWADEASKEIKVPFYFQDEALTTKEAERKAPNNLHSDALAAAIILQDYLDGQKD